MKKQEQDHLIARVGLQGIPFGASIRNQDPDKPNDERRPTVDADLLLQFRITIDSRVVNNGAAKPIAVAEPSDSTLTARNQHNIEPNCDRPRCRCSR